MKIWTEKGMQMAGAARRHGWVVSEYVADHALPLYGLAAREAWERAGLLVVPKRCFIDNKRAYTTAVFGGFTRPIDDMRLIDPDHPRFDAFMSRLIDAAREHGLTHVFALREHFDLEAHITEISVGIRGMSVPVSGRT